MSEDQDVETRLGLVHNHNDDYISMQTDDNFGIFVKKFNIVSASKDIYSCADEIWKDYEAREANPVGSEYYLDGMIFTYADYPLIYC